VNFLLDTNMASHAMNGHPAVMRKLRQNPAEALCVSSVTEAELRYGLHKRGQPIRLTRLLRDFLDEITVLAWRSEEARIYGALRAGQERQGASLAAMDLLLAAHAISIGATLVTNDRIFARVSELRWENWLEPPR